jgi:hypothetical protein
MPLVFAFKKRFDARNAVVVGRISGLRISGW